MDGCVDWPTTKLNKTIPQPPKSTNEQTNIQTNKQRDRRKVDKAGDWVKAAFASRNSQVYWTPPHTHLQVFGEEYDCRFVCVSIVRA